MSKNAFMAITSIMMIIFTYCFIGGSNICNGGNPNIKPSNKWTILTWISLIGVLVAVSLLILADTNLLSLT